MRIMKNSIFVIVSLLFPLGMQAQSNIGNHLAFMGIPMNGSLSAMVQRLQNTGFVELKDDDFDEFLDEETPLAAFMGYSEDRATMTGNFYGEPCIIEIHADPESKNVYSIDGSYVTCYANLWQAERLLNALIARLSPIYGTGKYTSGNAKEKKYCIQNRYGRLILSIKKLELYSGENDGKFSVNFYFFDNYNDDFQTESESKTEKSQSEIYKVKEIPWQQKIPLF